MIQIGVKSEFRQNLGRLGLFYGNKTQVPLVNFQPILQWEGEESTKLNVQIKSVDSTLDAGAQIQQMITAECIDSYLGKFSCLKSEIKSNFNVNFSLLDSPSLALSFRYNGTPQNFIIKLPLTVNKFFEPTEMNAESFFARWKNLGG